MQFHSGGSGFILPFVQSAIFVMLLGDAFNYGAQTCKLLSDGIILSAYARAR